MEFSSKISKILEFSGKSIASLSRELAVNPGYIQDLKSGKSKNPKTEFLSLLVEKLEVSPRWLLTGEGPMFQGGAPTTTTPLLADTQFEKRFPDVYSLYKDYEELKTRQGASGCKLCSKVNRMDRERSTRLEGYADALLSEQKQESKAKPLPIEEVCERQPSYKAEEELSNTPLLGRTAAGPPLDTERWPDEWRMVRLRTREDTRTHYLLEVTGTSMVDAGIPDNALILVRRAEEGRDGQIVIAHEPEEGVTLKRLANEGERRVLQWQDGSRRFLEVTEHTRIQGVFIRVIERPEEG